MKMQKLVYLAHGYSLVERNQPLVDELFEAWKFGPVLPSLYQSCKKYGKGSITSQLEDSEYGSIRPSGPPANPEVLKILDFVWENYGSLDAMELSEWTHEKEGPWDTVIRKAPIIFRNQSIDNNLIKEYFEKRMVADGSEET